MDIIQKDHTVKVHYSKSCEPLDKHKRFTLPKKKLRIKDSAKEVLMLLTTEFLTPKEIASRRNTSVRSVYKIIRLLKQKGMYDSAMNLNRSTMPFSEPLAHQIRLHGQEWNIKIIQKSEKYSQAMDRSNTIMIDGNTIRLYRESLEIYSGQSFFEKNEQEATKQSLAYLHAFLCRLEHEFGVVLIKPRSQNICLVNQHYAETNSEVAWDANSKGEKWRFSSDDDGKLFFVCDNSFNLEEMETLHPETAKQDMTKIRKQIIDWRKNDPPTNSQLANHIQGLVQTQGMFQENIKTHFEVLQSIKDAIKELNQTVQKLKQ